MINYKNVRPIDNFDWDQFSDGWNGTTLMVNKKIKLAKGHHTDKVYCHDKDAQEKYNAYQKEINDITTPKEITKNSLVKITDFAGIKDNELLVTINGGMNSIAIDLNKEGKFFNTMAVGGKIMNKDEFIECLSIPEHRQMLLDMNLTAKVNNHGDKASIWDGYVETLENEMKDQITKNNKAYWAHIDDCNTGGYFVTVAGTVKAFMPGSMAAYNKITDFQALLGKDLEVMVENYNSKLGFVVSRKKFLYAVLPAKLSNFAKDFKEHPDNMYTAIVTGTTKFGIFLEINEYLTGLIHKTLISDELNLRFKNNEILPGEKIDCWVYKIDNGRIILTDISPAEDREKIIAKREKEDNMEKLKIAKAEIKNNKKE